MSRALPDTDMMAGVPVRLDNGQVPVARLLCPNPGMMTGPGTNSYLIGERRLALVDPGPVSPAHLQAILEALQGRPLDWILVTHTHGDHSPGTAALQEETGATVVGLAAPGSQYQDAAFRPHRLYHDGERLDCDGFSVTLLHTPGHVSNHLCFLLEEEQMLFTGDHVLQGMTPVILPPDGDMRDYLRSLERLRDLPLASLAPGHGTLIANPAQAITTLIRHRLRREQKVVNVLQRQLAPVTLDELVAEVYDDVAQHLLPWAAKTLLAHLYKLEREERAAQRDGRWSCCG
ncbi:MAG: MBL fold metallo-hydrolase [Pseudohongiellaceae bacterium]